MANREQQAQIAKMLGLYDPKGGEICPTCGTMIDRDNFRDELSRREYYISGMCQGCQDRTFTDDLPCGQDECDAPYGDCTTCLSLTAEEDTVIPVEEVEEY